MGEELPFAARGAMNSSPRPPRIRVFADAESASRSLAEETATEVASAGREGWTVGLPTGNTPLALYRHWIRLHRAGELSFSEVRTFNLDEYWPAPAGATFADFMAEQLFAHTDFVPANCHLLDGRVSAAGIPAECSRFEAAIRAAGGLDLQLLGLGRNGHIGFNEPGSPADSRTRRVTLSADTRARAAETRAEWGACSEALTMGVETILEARRIVVLAFGEAKAAPVARAVTGDQDEAFPASFLQSHARVSWMLDPAAASLLPAALRVE